MLTKAAMGFRPNSKYCSRSGLNWHGDGVGAGDGAGRGAGDGDRNPESKRYTVPPYSLNVDSVRYKAVPVSPNAAPRRFKCMWTCATARAHAVTARARAEHRPRAA